ncbi:MAG TPA: NAD-dependent epimerase/dehydratase family protein, partial [Candidatus Binatia bacterium]|nr:NAD-dependent epimerase/dehydratase family protein [Candidatus Binatia bacterium]
MRVLVTGAAGFIGRRVVPRLVARGDEVVALVHRARSVAPSDRLVVVEGSVTDAAAVARAGDGCAAIVHLAASGAADAALVHAVNVDGTRNVLAAARAAGGARVVFTSSISALRERRGPYGETKRAAEEAIRASGLPWVILRPSLVYGELGTGLVAALARYLRTLPVVPVIGNGEIRLDPIHVDDVCDVIAQCLVRDDVVGRTYDLLGPERVTFNDFLRRLGTALGVERRLVHVPIAAALLGARVLGALSARPPITVDNVLGLVSPAAVDPAPLARDFTLRWTPLAAGLR